MVVAVLVMREVKSMIVGESAEPAMRAAIRAHIDERPEVVSVISLITLQWGDAIVVAVQAEMASAAERAGAGRCDQRRRGQHPDALAGRPLGVLRARSSGRPPP